MVGFTAASDEVTQLAVLSRLVRTCNPRSQ
jgi:hypothetical protein